MILAEKEEGEHDDKDLDDAPDHPDGEFVHAGVFPVQREEFQENRVQKLEEIQNQRRHRDCDKTEVEFFKKEITPSRQAKQHREKTEEKTAEKEEGGKRSCQKSAK